MYELPPDFDPSVFNDTTLESVLIAPGLLEFSFDNDLAIQAMEGVGFENKNRRSIEVHRFSEGPRVPPGLERIVGSRVIGASVEDGADIVLKFEGGLSTTILGDSPYYECYQIRGDDIEIIV